MMLYFNIVLYECLGKYLSFYEEIIIIGKRKLL